MAFTQQQLQALEALITQGVSSIKYQDREVRYQDVEKLLQLREKLSQALQQERQKPQRIYAQFSNGL